MQGDTHSIAAAGSHNILLGQGGHHGVGAVFAICLQHYQWSHTVRRRLGLDLHPGQGVQEHARQLTDMAGYVRHARGAQEFNARSSGIDVGNRRRPGFKSPRAGRKIQMLHVESEGIGLSEPTAHRRYQRVNQVTTNIEKRKTWRTQQVFKCPCDVEIDTHILHVDWTGSTVLIVVQHYPGALAVSKLYDCLDIRTEAVPETHPSQRHNCRLPVYCAFITLGG